MIKELVVAKYDKDISWLHDINNDVKISVYRKDNSNDNIIDKTNLEIFHLENIGREMHTYFHHIYNNYDNLSDYTFFVQDYPFDHWEDVITVINGDIETFKNRAAINFDGFFGYHFNTITVHSEKGGIMHTMHKSEHHGGGKIISCMSNGFPHDSNPDINVDFYWDIFFDEPKPKMYEFVPGAHFGVSKEQILIRPKNFYGKIIKFLEKFPVSPWICERLVCYYFNKKYTIK